MVDCRICDRVDAVEHFNAREMMFGLRDEFEYYRCGNCGCVQMAEPPADLSKYYPPDYYSFARPTPDGPLRRFLKHHLARTALGAHDLVGTMVRKLYGVPPPIKWLLRPGVHFEDAILDVGCGAGDLLYWLRSAGFSNLTGIDPFITSEVFLDARLTILQRTVEDLDQTFDFVILNHSLEHMDDPVAALTNVHRLLRPERFALIRLPLADSYAWRVYRTNWVQLDPPRHLFLPTKAGINILADRTGFVILEADYDSSALQFWGSEQYRQDIPFNDERSYAVNPTAAPFSAKDIARFERKAMQLNASQEGDQASFYLRRA